MDTLRDYCYDDNDDDDDEDDEDDDDHHHLGGKDGHQLMVTQCSWPPRGTPLLAKALCSLI